MKLSRNLLVLALSLFAVSSAGADITVQDKQGRSISIAEVVIKGEKVHFKKVGDPRLMVVPMTSFAEGSKELIVKEAAEYAKRFEGVFPELEIKSAIGKRTKKVAGSSYMERQTITPVFLIKNKDFKVPLGASKVKFLIFGQNVQNRNDLEVLNVQGGFSLAMGPGREATLEAKPFTTEYDDDRDSSNIGGYRYEGYVLIVTDEKSGKIVDWESSSGAVTALGKSTPQHILEMAKLKAGQAVNRELRPLN